MPFGAEVREDGSVRFRLWAPKASHVDLCLEGKEKDPLPLSKLDGGWFELITPDAGPGSHYRFQIEGNSQVPDPVSRFQPHDVHGPSEIIDPRSFDWKDDPWRGRPWEEAVLYELHVGTFTPKGTFRAVEQKLDYLRDLGVTAVELMPIADFPGARNWGYDGVLLYAPDSSYGRPEDLKHLVQAAHERELMIFLDVVYNHFGPEGNYLGLYSPQFFTHRHRTPWGDAINFDGSESRVVRDFFIHNAFFWLEEYHFDGLRLDAVHAIVDDSKPDILEEFAQVVRQRFANERLVHLVLENDDNAAHYLCRDKDNRLKLYTAQWNDDIHHTMHVAITGETEAYYRDYREGPIRHLGRCLAEGFAYQGEYSEYRGTNRGEPSAGLSPSAFVSFLQNHDQIGNRAFGERISQLARPEGVRTALESLLLAPSPPLIFMGEEYGATTPFLFFCDFQGDLASAVTTGRRNEFARFVKFSSAESRNQVPDPNAPQTFLQSKLDWESLSREGHAQWLKFYRELLSIRKRVVIPLVGEISRAEFRDIPPRGLFVEWVLANEARIELRANLGAEWLTIKPSSGEPFYQSSSEAAGALHQNCLPPWSVVWSLRK